MEDQQTIDPIGVNPGLLVDRVRRAETAGLEELRRTFGRGVRFLAARKLPPSQVDGCVREVFERMVRGIQAGELRDTEGLARYARMHLTTHVREIQERAERGPVTAPVPPATDEHRQLMQHLLHGLSPVERQSMVHFYVKGHDDWRICRDLQIPAEELQSLRVRVKARFHELLPAMR